MRTLPYAVRFAKFADVEKFLSQGWIVMIPMAAMHHHYYGIELAWICACPIPGLKTFVPHRVPHTAQQGGAHERERGHGA
jgi:hypothetical protein